ncbi:MAG: LysR family transcriptional regulator [Verrucomicrobia bacterium]|nr:LysR family transcriptional regulator [Verrucomicrobiota bacterium]
MNIHHLELFYYVAKHGGISEAARNMPYGIQQPAISGQIIQLEQFLGLTLFHRRPFELTPSGHELFQFIEPFFSNLDTMTRKLQGGTAHHIRIGASEIVLRDHMPELGQRVRKKFPQLTFTLREGYQPQIEAWLDKQEIDLGLTLLGERMQAGFSSLPLLRLPLMLIVPRKSQFKSAEDLWKLDRIEESLITLPAYESMCRNFQAGLSRKGLDWFPSIEVSSLKLIETYVASGYGIGLFLDIPKTTLGPGLRSLPLPDFEPVTFGALWRGKATPVIDALLEAVQGRAKEMKAGS